MMAFTGVAAWVVDYFRHYRWEIWVGWVFLVVGVGLFALWDGDFPLAMTASLQVIAGVGIGTIFTVPPIPMQASAPTAEDQSLAAGILVSFRQFGALIGLAVWATTFSNVFSRSIASVGALPESVALLSNAKETVGYIPPLRTVEIPLALKVAICEVYKEALRTTWYIVAGFGGGGVWRS
ncbi:hypothetical protein ETB97_009977 [Aspergillus alliaceus]|uniref:Major facilitator superfamily (MFS) profile domain-containing protein n=1 Tax=Petromyces alliaceus TaxID=209559 RepID=A0A8H6E8M5_PETAA|nr:hypothetical protein ETB97_009977 [Aspergillus burnettii]